MALSSSLNLSITSSDGSSTWTKPVTGLAFTQGRNQMYPQGLTIGTPAPVAAPTITPGTGGSMSSGVYKVKLTYVDAPGGESTPSPESTATVSASGTLLVASPAASNSAQYYNVYITAAAGSTGTETLQNSSPIPIGTNYTQSAAVASGAALPSSNSTLAWTVPLPQTPAQAAYIRNLAPAGIASPAAPFLSQAVLGSLSGATYFAQTTIVNASGETLASAEVSLAVSANNVLVVSAPAAPPAICGATGWNVYVASSSGAEVKQNTAPLPFNTPWTMPAGGLASNGALPASNTTVVSLNVTWTAQNNTSKNVMDLLPQSEINFIEVTSPGGYNGPALGGINALLLTASAAVGCPIEALIVG